MLLRVLKRAVKAALHEAVEEWAIEVGLPATNVLEARAHRLALNALAEAVADDQAAARLGVEDEEVDAELPRLTAGNQIHNGASHDRAGDSPAEVKAQEDAELLAWVHEQRQAGVPWTEVTRAAAGRVVELTEAALRARYRRWSERSDLPDTD